MERRGKVYDLNKNVLEASTERINYIFDNHEKVVVSLSGGKDSIVLAWLTYREAQRRNRKIYFFFLDQEMEYMATYRIIDEMMRLPLVIPLWFQIHGILPTAISHKEYWLEPWNPEERQKWIRQQKRVAIKNITWEHKVPWSFPEEKKMGFYGLMKCMEQMFPNESVAHLIGLRAEESLNRFRAVTKNAGIEGIEWCTKNKWGGIKFYPIYDWTFQDLWVYIAKNKLSYNKMYDFFYKKGYSPKDMRISSLMNRKAFHDLVDLQSFEPRLFDKLLDRAEGVASAARYAHEDKAFKNNKLPDAFNDWKKYRDYLISTLDQVEHRLIFTKRFAGQKENDYVYKQQCFQVKIHDITNSKKISNIDDPEMERRKQWMEEL